MPFWLMKAEPETRIEKGKDVRFSVDDFESSQTTSWEGVRNHEAKNLMKEMSVGDDVLFYHSNCKVPGVAGFAKVCKAAHPDYTAWDKEHPYYDPKSDPETPKWFMVDLKFEQRAAHLVPLALLKNIATSTSTSLISKVDYIGAEGIQAIKDMALVNRGRLSVQRVEKPAWDTVALMAEKGGWDEADLKKSKATAKTEKKPATGKKALDVTPKAPAKPKGIPRKRKHVEKNESDDDSQEEKLKVPAQVEDIRRSKRPKV